MAILGTFKEVHAGTVIIDEVVFEPTDLVVLLAEHGLPGDLPRDTVIAAESDMELHALLTATWSEWIDFLFVPTPKAFALYADHDEYTTFFASSQSKLDTLTAHLKSQGFIPAENYLRTG